MLDPTNGDWLGHIVAGKPETSVAYIVLARDIVNDIATRFGGQTVGMPCEAELEVTEAIAEIKRAIQLPEPQQTLTPGIFPTPVDTKKKSRSDIPKLWQLLYFK